MNSIIENNYLSEKSVEVPFFIEKILKYLGPIKSPRILDVGGIPTHYSLNEIVCNNSMPYLDKPQYDICDFRGGKYKGDFVKISIPEKYDCVIFNSSLEHFPQCTEGDLIYREGEDRKGYLKAIEVLSPKGIILLSVPFGKARWQPYHQNYDMSLIKELTKGTSILEANTYKLENNVWVDSDPSSMDDIIYTDRAYGVGCFVMQVL